MTESQTTKTETTSPHTRPYAGPSPLAAAAGRGSLLGLVGYGVGKVIGDVGMPAKQTAAYSRGGAYTVGGLLAVTGAILGAYTAMRDAQAAARQHYAMQKHLNALESAVENLPVPKVAEVKTDGPLQGAEEKIQQR